MINKLELNAVEIAINSDIADNVTKPTEYNYSVEVETFNLDLLKKLAAFHDSLEGYGKEYMETGHEITHSYMWEELTDGEYPGLVINENREEGQSQDTDCIIIYTIDGVTRMTGVHWCSAHEWIYKVIETGGAIE